MDVEKSYRRTCSDKKVASVQNCRYSKAGEKTDSILCKEKKSGKKSQRRKKSDRLVQKKAAAIPSSQVDKSPHIQVHESSSLKQKPIISILQRPRTKEVAAEHFAKFSRGNAKACPFPEFHEDLEDSVALENGQREDPSSCCVGHADATQQRFTGESSHPLSKVIGLNEIAAEEVFDGDLSPTWPKLVGPIEIVAKEAFDVELSLTLSNLVGPTEIGAREGLDGGLETLGGLGQILIQSPDTSLKRSVGLTEISAKEAFDGGLELLGGLGQLLTQSPEPPLERWAGSAYTNSPPPNALPFPTFLVQHVKSCTTDESHTKGPLLRPMDGNCQRDMPRLSTRILLPQIIDPSSTAKDLKTILKIDLDRRADDESPDGIWKWKEELSISSATRELKKILELN